MSPAVDVVPRESELLIEIVGTLAQAHPADRRRLAASLREDGLHEVFDLPSVGALCWLAARLPGARTS